MKSTQKAIPIESDRLHVLAFRQWMLHEMEPGRLLTVYELRRWWTRAYHYGQTFTLSSELLAELKARIAELIFAQGGELITAWGVVVSDGTTFQARLKGVPT